MNKIISYLGFAIKSQKLLIGQSTIKDYQKQIHLIIVDDLASENLKHLAINVAKKQNCVCIISKVKIDELTKFDGVKIIALIDENLSKAIIDNKEKISIE